MLFDSFVQYLFSKNNNDENEWGWFVNLDDTLLLPYKYINKPSKFVHKLETIDEQNKYLNLKHSKIYKSTRNLSELEKNISSNESILSKDSNYNIDIDMIFEMDEVLDNEKQKSPKNISSNVFSNVFSNEYMITSKRNMASCVVAANIFTVVLLIIYSNILH